MTILLRLVLVLLMISFCPEYLGDPGDLSAKIQRSRELMSAGKFEEAIPVCKDVVQALPNNPGPLLNLGIALHMAGHDKEALSQFQAILKLEPNHLPARLFLGAAYLGLGAAEKAIAPLSAVVRSQPNNRDARLFLGQAHLSLEQFQAALDQFDKLATLDPQNPKVWNGLGLSHEGLAGQTFESLEKVAPESAYWLVLVAEAISKGDEYQRAFFFYREALAKKPDLRGVHPRLAEIYNRDGHADWAATEQEKERTLPSLNCSEVPGASSKEGAGTVGSQKEVAQKLECAFWSQRYRDVIALAKAPTTPETIFWKTRAYSELASQAFDHLAQLPPSAEMHELLAKMHYSRRKYPAATKEWKEALKLAPLNPFYQQGLAISLSAGRDFDQSVPLLEDLLKQTPDSPELNYWLGFSHLGLENPEASLPFLEKAVAGDPSVLPARRDLARAYLRVGQTEKAIPHLQAALPIDEDGGLYYLLAQAYRKEGRREQEQEMLKKFQERQDMASADKKKFEQQIQITPP